MPDDQKSNNSADIAKSYVALNTLRDYVYQQKPKHLLATDFVEDIPSLRPFGSAFANILPSASIISKDPAERHKQISEAVRRVHQASKKDHPVAQEALTSAAKFGLGSIPLSLAFGMAEKSFHVPGLKNMMKGERPRITFKENFSSPEKKQELKRYLLDSTKAGVGQGALFGATPALLSSNAPFDKDNVNTAAKVLNDHPTLSSLPGADIAALRNSYKDKDENPTKTHIENTLGGGAAAGAGALAIQGASTGLRALHNVTAPITTNLNNNLAKKLEQYTVSRGKPNTELKGTGLKGSGGPDRRTFGSLRKNIQKSFPQKTPSLFSKKEILEPLSWKGMRKPVLGLTALGLGLSGLGSYMSHPNRRDA